MTDQEREELTKKLNLTPAIIRQYLGRIAWRREMKKSLRGEFDEKYPENILTMFLLPGNAFFDKEVLSERYKELTGYKPHATASNGQLQIFNPRVANRRYIIGADPASGRTVEEGITSGDPNERGGTDFSAAVVLDMDTEEEMAAYRARVTPSDFAADLADLGRYYNTAPIAVERTGDGGAVILVLSGDCKYTAIVKFKEWHRKKRSTTGKELIEIEGFPTNLRTRPIALNYVSRWIMEKPECIFDKIFVTEALSFVRDERGIPSGANGSHDDTVSARWIAHGSRMHLLGYWTPGDGLKEGYQSPQTISLASA